MAARTDGVEVWDVVGNHGLEPWSASPELVTAVKGWRGALEAALAGESGILIEDKRYSVAIHYRHAPDRARAEALIRATAAKLDGARILGGKCVVNLVPAGAPDKGQALAALRDRLGCESAIYLGDDESDEDVFASDDDRILGIRVEADPSSRARWYLGGQEEVDTLLGRLVEIALRQPLPASTSISAG